MSEVRFSRRAREDLLDIWLYIAGKLRKPRRITFSIVSKTRVERWRGIQSSAPRVLRSPTRRSLIIQRRLALYRLTSCGVQIVRIIDGARDFKRVEWARE